MILACGLNSIIRVDGNPQYSMTAMLIGANSEYYTRSYIYIYFSYGS